MSEWLRPILGAALLLAGAGGLAYKVISGYQHASPDAFFSVHDQNKPSAASAADHTTEGATAPVDVAAPPQGPATGALSAASAPQGAASAPQGPASALQTAPITTAPPAESGNTLAIASRAASNVPLPTEVQDNPACVPIETEQREIQGALKKPYSPEQGRFMQRRLRDLAEQSVNLKCAE
jgi:hypothetical protein